MTYRILAIAFIALLACGPSDLQIECHFTHPSTGDPYGYCASLIGAPAVVVCPYAESMTDVYCANEASPQCEADYYLTCQEVNSGTVCLCECLNWYEYCEL